MGIESGAPAIVDGFDKGIDWTDVERAIDVCRRAGIPRVVGFAGVFAPGETLETLSETRRKFHELDMPFHVNIWFPYPSTAMYLRGVTDGTIPQVGAGWNSLLPAAGTIGNAFTTAQVRRWCRRTARAERLRYHMRRFGRTIRRIGRTTTDRYNRKTSRRPTEARKG